MSKWILASFLIVAPAFGAESTLTCGDHWLKVTLEWTVGSGTGTIYFSGDSQPERTEAPADVADSGDDLFVQIKDNAGGYLTAEGMKTNNPSATLKETDKGSPTLLGNCYLN